MNTRRATALATLVRARVASVDAARMALADAVAIEARAHDTLRAAEADIRRQTQAATDSPDDAAVASLGVWLTHAGRPAQRRAELALDHAQSAVTVARATLALARGDAQLAQNAAAEHERMRRRLAARATAHADDDRARAALVRPR